MTERSRARNKLLKMPANPKPGEMFRWVCELYADEVPAEVAEYFVQGIYAELGESITEMELVELFGSACEAYVSGPESLSIADDGRKEPEEQ